MNLSVPTRLEDVDRKWLLNLVCLVDNINCVEEVKVRIKVRWVVRFLTWGYKNSLHSDEVITFVCVYKGA